MRLPLIIGLLASTAAAQLTLAPSATELALDKGLAVDGVSKYARRPINTDAVIMGIADGSLNALSVKAGDLVGDGHAWKELEAKDGVFGDAKPGTYVLVRVHSDSDRVMLLNAGGDAMVYVNGEPHMGDPYGSGYASLPVHLRKGENAFLFSHAGRGAMRASLRAPAAALSFVEGDTTLPDVHAGQSLRAFIGVPVLNASTSTRHIAVRATCGSRTSISQTFSLPPCSITKLPLAVDCAASEDDAECPVELVMTENSLPAASRSLSLRVYSGKNTHRRTYASRVDGSAQYIAIVPPKDDAPSPALVLSLHGASVEANGQAGSYVSHVGAVIACPTNRRPYGFDWEDWGRIDAIESMDLAKDWYKTDPTRQYLTGHSMGGHGTWNIGVLFADRFAAVAPSAGWLSFDSYMGAGGPPHAPDSPLGKVFQNARASSMTLDFFENLRGKGIFILHGDADDNVPVEQARTARKALDELKIPYAFHEQPGAGHWWDDDKPGAACLDWPGIWETFAGARLAPGATQKIPAPLDARGFVNGSFKRVFDRSFTLVYSTGGGEETNAWSLAKARFDAEQWWYRGNGYAPVISDAEFLASPREGNVILYGTSESNKAFGPLVATDALRLSGGELRLDGRRLKGKDLACLATLPRKDAPDSLVGLVGGTGPAGFRAVERLGYFSSGVGFPEVVILRAAAWKEGFDAVQGAGSVGRMTWK
jgi:poly(3-hydroxybutyrate) depolymerase